MNGARPDRQPEIRRIMGKTAMPGNTGDVIGAGISGVALSVPATRWTTGIPIPRNRTASSPGRTGARSIEAGGD